MRTLPDWHACLYMCRCAYVHSYLHTYLHTFVYTSVHLCTDVDRCIPISVHIAHTSIPISVRISAHTLCARLDPCRCASCLDGSIRCSRDVIFRCTNDAKELPYVGSVLGCPSRMVGQQPWRQDVCTDICAFAQTCVHRHAHGHGHRHVYRLAYMCVGSACLRVHACVCIGARARK